MSASRVMTLEWLRDRNFRHKANRLEWGEITDVNAHWVVIDGEIDRVPAEIFREFLAITGDGGFSTLQLMWDFSIRKELKLVPSDMLTRQLLTTSVPARDSTPIELAAANGNLDLIPWSSFVAVEWIPHLRLLHKATTLCEEHQYDENVWEHNGDGGLCAFIRKVEKMRRIKQVLPWKFNDCEEH